MAPTHIPAANNAVSWPSAMPPGPHGSHGTGGRSRSHTTHLDAPNGADPYPRCQPHSLPALSYASWPPFTRPLPQPCPPASPTRTNVFDAPHGPPTAPRHPCDSPAPSLCAMASYRHITTPFDMLRSSPMHSRLPHVHPPARCAQRPAPMTCDEQAQFSLRIGI